MVSGITDESKKTRALAILKEAKSGGMLKKEIPIDDPTRIKLADYVVEEARKRKEKGERGKHINNILFTADVDWSGDEDERRYREYIAEEVEIGLPIPKEIRGEIPEVPQDLTELSTNKLRKIFSEFNSVSARIGWLLTLEESGEQAAKQIADAHEDAYIANADRKDIGGKPKTNKLLEIEAKINDERIVKWRERQHKHTMRARKYEALLEMANNACDRMSREFTMREER